MNPTRKTGSCAYFYRIEVFVLTRMYLVWHALSMEERLVWHPHVGDAGSE